MFQSSEKLYQIIFSVDFLKVTMEGRTCEGEAPKLPRGRKA
jgi:hypothetical protein